MRLSSVAALAALAALCIAAPARATSHCWCRLVKSDCGDCSTSCTVQDFGEVAEFGTFELHKDALCTQACNDKLSGTAPPAVCTDLATNLHVPLPWSGQIEACWHVGAGTDEVANRESVTCAAPPPPSNYPPPGEWRRVTFFDDFKGKPADATPEIAACYDRAPSCVAMYAESPEPCPADKLAGLAALDKCTWTVQHKDVDVKEASSYDPREVRVDPSGAGTLYLTTHALRPDGSYADPGPSHLEANGQREPDHPYVDRDDWEPGYDCAVVPDPWNGHPLRHRCPFAMGSIVSQKFAASGGAPGYGQEFGRFEFRIQLPYGTGSFPAAWLLPVDGEWPGAGELDVFETKPAADHVYQTLHSGICRPGGDALLHAAACASGGGTPWHQHKDGGSTYPTDLADATPFWQGFHTFAVDWEPGVLRFSVDGRVFNTIHELDYVDTDAMGVPHHWWNKKKWFAQLPTHVPSGPFYFILDTTLTDDNGKLANPKNFVPQSMAVDWVRATQRCLTQQDFCPKGGDLDVPSGRCIPPATDRPLTYPSPCTRQ